MAPRGILLACTFALAAHAAGAQQDVRGDQSKALEGRWAVELTLDPRSTKPASATLETKGQIAFGTSSWWGNADRFGRHDVDTRPFFGRTFARPLDVPAFSPADTSMVTEVSGSLSRDSLAVDFIPRLDRWGISLRGRFFGDSALGRWHRRGTDGSGYFVLRRVSKEAVSVAAIPVPKRAEPTATVASARTPAKGGKKAAAKGAPEKAVATTAKAGTGTPAQTLASSARSTQTSTPPASASPTPTVATTTPVQVASTAAATPAATTASTPAANVAAPAAASGATTGSTAPPPSAAPANPAVPVVTVVANKALGPTGAAAATGALRVRMYDRASKQWFVTKYALQLPDKRWMYGNLRSGTGPEGWGRVVAGRNPGRYNLEVTDFVCGDKLWFLAKKIVQPVEINAGETTDVTIEMDLTAVPAKKSIDNRAGAKCAAAPGVPR